MRLWSLHPSYLDAKGLVALWREALLARAVLLGTTKGYRNHPQLQRFKAVHNPIAAIDRYLYFVHMEAELRGYNFDRSKFSRRGPGRSLQVTDGQLRYELAHLKKKLRDRDPKRYRNLSAKKQPQPHPLFTIVAGEIETWEKRS